MKSFFKYYIYVTVTAFSLVSWFYFCFLCRFLKSKPQATSPKPNSLSGLEEQPTPHANQAPSSPFDWSSFLCAAMQEEKLKTNSSCLAITESEQQELYETIRRALHSLRKHKASMTSTSAPADGAADAL